MSGREVTLYSFVFSIMAGIVNVLGIKKLNIVLTNVTGHLSEAVLVSSITSLLYIAMYALGAFWSYGCFGYAKNKTNNWAKVLPVLLNIAIFLYAIVAQSLPSLALFFAMSSQNAIGSNHSQARVKPSQITGVVMNAMQDLSNYLLENNKQQKSQYLVELMVKMLNIIGFSVGGFIAFYYNSINVLWLPVFFYVLLATLILTKRI